MNDWTHKNIKAAMVSDNLPGIIAVETLAGSQMWLTRERLSLLVGAEETALLARLAQKTPGTLVQV